MRPEGLEPPTDRICTTLSDGTARSLRIPYPAKVITPNRSKEFTTIQERLRIPLRQRCGQREDSAPPVFIRMDNGPEMTCNAIADWCRFSTTGSVFIEPGAPWQNAFVESFNGKLRD